MLLLPSHLAAIMLGLHVSLRHILEGPISGSLSCWTCVPTDNVRSCISLPGKNQKIAQDRCERSLA